MEENLYYLLSKAIIAAAPDSTVTYYLNFDFKDHSLLELTSLLYSILEQNPLYN